MKTTITKPVRICDEANNTAMLHTDGIDWQEAKYILDNVELLSADNLRDIISYHFFQDKHFYLNTKREFVCEYSNQTVVITDYYEMVAFVKQLEF